MSTWNSSPQRELTTNPLSGKLGADQAELGNISQARDLYQQAISTGHPEVTNEAQKELQALN